MSAFDISSIDKNLTVETEIRRDGLCFYNVRRAPFDLYGFYNPTTEPDFKRLPDEIGKNVNSGVAHLYLHTAGGRVRFSTDSQNVAIDVKMFDIARYSHMTLCGTAGFDIYIDDPETGKSRYYKTFMPSYKMVDGYESKITFPDKKLRHITIHFPLYSGVHNLFVGLDEGSAVGHGMSYRPELPIVYYGSSITQGACASRPGNAYQNILSRMIGVDHLNLGFSGSGKAEPIICEYMAELPMSAFVSDYDHNAPTVEYLKDTHLFLYKTIREKNPALPYIMLSRPDYAGKADSAARRNVIRDTYLYAKAQGDEQVWFIDGEQIFNGAFEDICTVDTTHPNDYGFVKMAEVFLPILENIFGNTRKD